MKQSKLVSMIKTVAEALIEQQEHTQLCPQTMEKLKEIVNDD